MKSSERASAVDFERVQAHYDVGNDFYRLFLDPSMTYSCAKFDSASMSLADAQRAKIDLSLGKCELKPGDRLLDVGCGWGAVAMRAADHYGARVIGLTLSQQQIEFDQQLAAGCANVEFRLQGWETFDEPVDRIISIGAFEHFGRAKYQAFFEKCRAILPGGGVLLLHTITAGRPTDDWDVLRFVYFIRAEIFPGGDIPGPETVVASARAAGFELVHAESLRPDYARTLDCWAANLQSNQAAARALVGEETYAKYMKYLTGCAALFRSGECNIHQFKLRVVQRIA